MRLIRRITILILLMMGLIGGAVLRGRTISGPISIQTLRIDFCGTSPCFLGIIPGITTWEDAKAVVALYGYDLDSAFPFANADAVSVAADSTGHVGNIDIQTVTPNSNLPVVSDYIEKFGSPCAISDLTSIYGITLIYPRLMVSVGQPLYRLDPGLQVVELQIIDPAIIADNLSELCTLRDLRGYPVINWSGFQTLQFYESQGLHRLP
jgi:hypothetical protein